MFVLVPFGIGSTSVENISSTVTNHFAWSIKMRRHQAGLFSCFTDIIQR
jgi:hypothetical protein